ncbi:MAG: Na+/H+ antiporter NhaB [Candidatus Endobugula sp.]|jgi:Na+/H+ antiporter NhaB
MLSLISTTSREHFEDLTEVINTGTNLPSLATPNEQAACLFLLMHALDPSIRLSYGRFGASIDYCAR